MQTIPNKIGMMLLYTKLILKQGFIVFDKNDIYFIKNGINLKFMKNYYFIIHKISLFLNKTFFHAFNISVYWES